MAQRVAVMGTCQVDGVAAAIGAFNPSVEITIIEASSLLTQTGRAEAAETIKAADTFIAIEPPPSTGEFAWNRIRGCYPNVTLIPIIIFDGHYPDLIYLDTASRNIKTPVGQYHSRILLASFLSGRSPRQTELLFNPFVYAKLGYFEQFDKALAHLRSYLGSYDQGFDAMIDQWRARGCFMYSSNHPKPYVMADLARFAMGKAGIPIEVEPAPSTIVDTFAFLPRFPVYPEIAQRLGFEGSLEFVGAGTFGLSHFIAESFDLYSRLSRRTLMCRPIQEASALMELT